MDETQVSSFTGTFTSSMVQAETDTETFTREL